MTDSTEKFTDTDVKVQIARDQAPQLAKKAKKESVSEAAGRAAVWGGDRMAASLAEFLCRSTPLFANFLPIFFFHATKLFTTYRLLVGSRFGY